VYTYVPPHKKLSPRRLPEACSSGRQFSTTSLHQTIHSPTGLIFNQFTRYSWHNKMPPRLIHLSSPLLRATPVQTFRIILTRHSYSTSSDNDVIKTQQIPAPGSGNISVLLLNRPNARNALSKSLLNSLAKQVQSISAEGGTGPTRALVLASSTDTAFCAGADLKERAGMSKDEYVCFQVSFIKMAAAKLTFR
jgi:hypothetical protein